VVFCSFLFSEENNGTKVIFVCTYSCISLSTAGDSDEAILWVVWRQDTEDTLWTLFVCLCCIKLWHQLFFCYFKLHGVVLSIGVNAEGSQGPDPQYLTCICPVCWTPVTPTQSRVQRQFKKCFTFSSKCTKMRLVARPRWGAYSAPPDPTPSWIKGGRKEGEEEGKERGRTPNVWSGLNPLVVSPGRSFRKELVDLPGPGWLRNPV